MKHTSRAGPAGLDIACNHQHTDIIPSRLQPGLGQGSGSSCRRGCCSTEACASMHADRCGAPTPLQQIAAKYSTYTKPSCRGAGPGLHERKHIGKARGDKSTN